jgi:hypothetical protein
MKCAVREGAKLVAIVFIVLCVREGTWCLVQDGNAARSWCAVDTWSYTSCKVMSST